MAISPTTMQAKSLYLGLALNKTKTDLAQVTASLASGEVPEIGRELSGNTQQLSMIESEMGRLKQERQNTTELLARWSYAYEAAEHVRKAAGDFTSTANLSAQLSVPAYSASAEHSLKEVLGALNASFAGTYIFARSTDGPPPVSNPASIVEEIEGLAAGIQSGGAIIEAVDAWFESPQGFARLANLASTDAQSGAPRSDQETNSADTSASMHPAGLKNTLKGLALASISGSLDGIPAEQKIILSRANELLGVGERQLIDGSAIVGRRVASHEAKLAQVESAMSTLQKSRNDIRGADMEEAASNLTQIEQRLDLIYNIVARISRLSLAEYIR